MSVAALALLAVVAGPGGETALTAARLAADAGVLEHAVDRAHFLVDVALARPDAFPARGPVSAPELTDAVWARLADHVVALDGTQHWYGSLAPIEDPGLRDEAFVVAYTARLAVAGVVLALDALAAGSPALAARLDAAQPRRGLPAGVFSRLRAAAASPGLLAFLEPAARRDGAARARLRAAGFDRVRVKGWMLPYLEQSRRALGAGRAPPTERRDLDAAHFSAVLGAASPRAAAWPADPSLPALAEVAVPDAPARTDAVRRRLRPGDVLLVRRDRFRLLAGGPGFWTGAGVFVGTAPRIDETFNPAPAVRQLFRRRGVPDGRLTMYLRLRFPDAFRRWMDGSTGPSPLEVVVPDHRGVSLRTLAEVVAADAVAVLRPDVRVELVARSVGVAFHHVGRLLDHAGDLASDRAIGPAELVWKGLRSGDGLEGLAPPIATPGGTPELTPTDLAAWAAAGPSWEVLLFAEGGGAPVTGAAARRALAASADRPSWGLPAP